MNHMCLPHCFKQLKRILVLVHIQVHTVYHYGYRQYKQDSIITDKCTSLSFIPLLLLLHISLLPVIIKCHTYEYSTYELASLQMYASYLWWARRSLSSQWATFSYGAACGGVVRIARERSAGRTSRSHTSLC